MTLYAFIQNGEIMGKGSCPVVNEDIKSLKISEDVYKSLERYKWNGKKVVLNPNYDKEQRAKRKAEIQEFSITRFDLFDSTIKAWGADSNDLLPIVRNLVENSEISNIEKKTIMNTCENAPNFYRKDKLFTLLSGVPITIGNEIVTVTEDMWDSFFDEKNKQNPDAYRELLPASES